jgi:hypothetical protein
LRFPDAILGSSLTGEGIPILKERIIQITETLDKQKQKISVYS